MALHWDISKCKEVEEIKGEKEWPITENIIWLTLAVDIGDITEKNWKEFLFRIKVMEKLLGPFLYKTFPAEEKSIKKPFYYTTKIIKRRIGLHTNVVTKSRSAWLKRTLENVDRDIMREIETEVKEEEKEAI